MAIAYVNQTSISADNASTATTPALTTSTGQTFFVVVASTNQNENFTITDTYGNTWVALPKMSMSFNGMVRAYYCINGTGGASHTVTATGGTTYGVDLIWNVYSGLSAGGGVIDQQAQASNSSSSSNSITISSGTTQMPNELVIAYTSTETTATNLPATDGAPWGHYIVEDATATASGITTALAVEDKVVSATGVQTARFQDNDVSTIHWNVGIVTFTDQPIAIAPTETVSAASSVAETTATLNGNITSIGTATPTTRGFVYDTVSHGTTPGNVAPGSSGYASHIESTGSFSTGAYTNNATGLAKNTTYYVRAYAQNSVGYSYSTTEISFTTLPGTPLIDALSASSLGFADVTNAGDTSPFASGDTIGYTVQSGQSLAPGTYYWRVRATDPTGSGKTSSWSAIRSFTISAGTPESKTQTADARIQKSFTLTQGANARIAGAFTKTQSSISRIQKALTAIQTANSRVAKSFTKTQTSVARISEVATKTQSAIARLSKAFTSTQAANARIAKTGALTQLANARIQKSGSLAQAANARVQKSLNKTQSASAYIVVLTPHSTTQSANGRIQKSFTVTQPANARIAKAFTKTQGALARLSMVVAKTQTANSRVAKSFTKTQGAIANIARTTALNQTSVARIQKSFTATQTSNSRIQKTATKTQAASAYIVVLAPRSTTQTATARIAKALTAIQTANGRIAKAFTKTQGAISRIAKAFTSTQTGNARIQKTFTSTRPANARLVKVITKTQTATATIAMPPQLYSRGAYPSLPVDNTRLSTVYSAAEVTTVSSNTNTTDIDLLSNASYSLHEFSVNVGNSGQPMTIIWTGHSTRPATAAPIQMQIYNITSSTWETLTTNNTANGGDVITLNAVQSTNVTNYVDGNNYAYVRIYQ